MHPIQLDDIRGHHRGARGDARSNFLFGLLTDAIVLHGDERYQPCGSRLLEKKSSKEPFLFLILRAFRRFIPAKE